MTADRDRVRRILGDLITFTEIASRIVARGNDSYRSDETLRLAAEAVLHKIGEAVARLPVEFTEQHPDVPWRAIKAMRNIVAHQYEQVDYGIIWNAMTNRLPADAKRIRTILARIDARTE